MKLPLFVRSILLLAGVLVFLFWVSDTTIRQTLSIAHNTLLVENEAREILETLNRTAGWEVQLKKTLDDFHTEVYGCLEQENPALFPQQVASLQKTHLERFLPPFDLYVALYNPFLDKMSVRWGTGGRLGLTPDLAQTFLQGCLSGKFHPTMKAPFLQGLRQAMQMPLPLDTVSRSWAGHLQLYTVIGARKALFWGYMPIEASRPTSAESLFLALLDVEHLPRDFGIQKIFRDWQKPGIGLGFFDAETGQIRFAPFFDRHPDLRIAIQTANLNPSTFQTQLSSFHLFMSQDQIDGRFRPFIAVPVLATQVSYLSLLLTPAMFFLVFGSLLLGQLLFFCLRKRWFRFSVGPLLLCAFLLVAGFTIVGISGISRVLLGEEIERNRQVTARHLQTEVSHLDHGIAQHHVEFVKILRRFSRSPLLRTMIRSEEKGTLTRPLEELMAQHLNAELMRELRTDLKAMFILHGTRGITRSYSPSSALHLGGNANEMNTLLINLARRSLENNLRTLPRGPRPPGHPETPIPEFSTRGKIEFEVVREILYAALSPETMFKVGNFPFQIEGLRLNVGKIFFSQFPIYFTGEPLYLLLWIWDEAVFQDSARKIVFEPFLDTSSSSIYFMDPRNAISTAFPWEPDKPGIDSHPDLLTVLEKARTQQSGVREILTTATQAFVLDVRIAQNHSRMVIAGKREIPNHYCPV
jgi:hypothetical protein